MNTDDWQNLLMRYMTTVIDAESISFLTHADPDMFTLEEMTLLEEIEEEARLAGSGRVR